VLQIQSRSPLYSTFAVAWISNLILFIALFGCFWSVIVAVYDSRHDVMLCYVVPCYGQLWYVMLCYAMLCEIYDALKEISIVNLGWVVCGLTVHSMCREKGIAGKGHKHFIITCLAFAFRINGYLWSKATRVFRNLTPTTMQVRVRRGAKAKKFKDNYPCWSAV